MAKDPAFLFYPTWWFGETADMTHEEKGVFIDLLSHQHYRGGLPPDQVRIARLVGMSYDEFLKVWKRLESLFVFKDGVYVNEDLEDKMIKRALDAKKKRISGEFGSFLRKKNLEKDVYAAAKKAFSVDDFLDIRNEDISKEISIWYTTWYSTWSSFDGNSIKTTNTNITKDKNKISLKDRSISNYVN